LYFFLALMHLYLLLLNDAGFPCKRILSFSASGGINT
jgi:hypothetical protein